ncbi:uncharacterized protein [Palaemon carinicauda]|uniref:uncharacterized protein n=1 Tax=Palaemon carinicauda TaxID=392227 RepID=UPI0035B5BF9E
MMSEEKVVAQRAREIKTRQEEAKREEAREVGSHGMRMEDKERKYEKETETRRKRKGRENGICTTHKRIRTVECQCKVCNADRGETYYALYRVYCDEHPEDYLADEEVEVQLGNEVGGAPSVLFPIITEKPFKYTPMTELEKDSRICFLVVKIEGPTGNVWRICQEFEDKDWREKGNLPRKPYNELRKSAEKASYDNFDVNSNRMTPVFNESDRYKIRLWKISDEVISPLLRLFLNWGNPDWDQKIKFLTYLENKKVEINKLKKKLYPEQLKTLEKYPPDVAKWDITLICLLLKHCKGVFAGKDDIAWSSASGKEPECLITYLKDIRNTIAHEALSLNQKDFFDKIEEIRSLIERALCSVGRICSHVSQTEIDANVANFNKKLNEIRDADISPKTLDEYKKELLFSEQMALIRNKGVPFLKKVLNRNTTINPLSLIVKGGGRQLPVNEIFTEIELNQDGENKEVLLEDIIDVASGSDAGSFILLKGHAGMGKSTLVKKITSDWANQRSSIKGLSSFHLLFYAELRDIINTFVMLIKLSLGEKVHRSFSDKDLVEAVLSQRTLVILDGYDEVNKNSSDLFNHILSLNKHYSQLTVIVTTRPEAEEKLNAHLHPTALNAVHLRLVGIKANKREEFVKKYFLSLPNDSSVLQELDNLLKFLKKTEHKMSIVWEVAYNLCLLTILWMFKPDDVNRITTEAELYWQIFLLIISKLEERLQRNPSTCDLELSVLQHKITIFLEELSLESLKGLKDDFINLPHSVYRRLTALCLRLELPIEELAGAFLKKVTSFNNSYYTFPHKGFMEFMGGYNIYKQVTGQDGDLLSIQEWGDELYQTRIPLQIQLKMLASLKSTKTTSVTDFVKELHGGSLPDSLEKYQNLLIQTLSIFHVGEGEVPLATKIETLELLEKSGLKRKDSFLKVMHNIKCNDMVARWIAQRFRLIDDDTRITDSSFESYIALLAATDPPLPNRDEIRISIDLYETISGFEVLTKHLLRHQVYPREIYLHRSFREFTSINAEETESIKSLLSKGCEIYRGIWNPTFQIPPNVKELRVRLPDQVSLDAFCQYLQETKEIGYIVMNSNDHDGNEEETSVGNSDSHSRLLLTPPPLCADWFSTKMWAESFDLNSQSPKGT